MECFKLQEASTTTTTTTKPELTNRLASVLQSGGGDEDRGKPSRINNRGPPRLSEIPFENIPLEVLSSVQPGQTPPFQVKKLKFIFFFVCLARSHSQVVKGEDFQPRGLGL